MDDLSLYKLKEALTTSFQSIIDSKLSNEKALLRDYIGLGVKIGATGIGIAILSIGFFGWKSYNDISTSINSEIKQRFDNQNPVRKYELMLRDVSIDSIVDALSIQQSNNKARYRPADESSTKFLLDALTNDNVSIEKKARILDYAIRYDSADFARASRALININYKDTDDADSILARVLDLYTNSSNPSTFVTDVKKVADQYKDSKRILRSASRFLLKLDNSEAQPIKEIFNKSEDRIVKFNYTIFNIKQDEKYQINREYMMQVINSAESSSFFDSDDPNLYDVLRSVNSIDGRNQNFWTLCSLFGGALREKGYIVEEQNDVGYGAYGSGQTYIALRNKTSSLLFGLKEYSDILRKITDAFWDRNHDKPFSEADISTLEYWQVKSNTSGQFSSGRPISTSYRSYCVYSDYKDVIFVGSSGENIRIINPSKKIILRPEQENGHARMNAYWRDTLGETHSQQIIQIKNIDTSRIMLKQEYLEEF